MPKWVKILLGVLAVGIVLIIGATVAVTMFAGDLMKKASDPAEISKTVNSFADIPQLPSGFEYQMQMDFSILKFVSIKHGDDMNLILGVIPLESQADNAEAIMAQLDKKQVTGSKDFKVVESGNETVGGENLLYKIGTSEDVKSGNRVPTMLGIVTPKGWSKKAVFVFGTQMSGENYDMASTKQFLGSIKGFHQ